MVKKNDCNFEPRRCFFGQQFYHMKESIVRNVARKETTPSPKW